ncbi:MAG: hypothetical protein ACWA5K_01690 [bacterium]
MTLYLLQNSDNAFLNKEMIWGTDSPRNTLFATPHRDVALNQLIELNGQDIQLRARVIECKADDKGLPILPQTEKIEEESKEYAATESEACSA